MYNDQEQMIDDQILCDFLDNAVLKAKERIRLEGRIETEDAIPLMLKSQFNHIAHLETKMVTKDEFNARFGSLTTEFNARFGSLTTEFNARFSALESQFFGLKEQVSGLKWFVMLGFTLLGLLQTYIAFIR